MKLEEIDRALREDETITPSSDFTARTMRAVREEAEDLGAIAFPWPRVVPGIVVCALALVAGLMAGPPAIDPETVREALGRVLQAIPVEIVAAVLVPLLGSWVLVRFSLRLAGYER